MNSIELAKRICNCISDGYDDEEYREDAESKLYNELSQIENESIIKIVLLRLCERIEELEEQSDNMEFMEIVREICNTKSTDCRSLNKRDLARKLMGMVNIPKDATITEIPLDWTEQVEICFTIPDDNNYYALSAGHWLNNTESIYLSIIGTQKENEFDFFENEKEIDLDYFTKNRRNI